MYKQIFLQNVFFECWRNNLTVDCFLFSKNRKSFFFLLFNSNLIRNSLIMNGLKGNKPTNVIFFLAFTYPIYTLHKMDWICWFVEILLLYVDHIYCCSCNLCSCSWFAKMVNQWALSAVLWRGTTLTNLALLLLPSTICKCCILEVKKWGHAHGNAKYGGPSMKWFTLIITYWFILPSYISLLLFARYEKGWFIYLRDANWFYRCLLIIIFIKYWL